MNGTVSFDFSETCMIVTGSSKGIGKDIAFQLMARGARVGITGRDTDALRMLHKEAVSNGWRCDTYTVDLAQVESIGPMVKYFAELFGRIDGLVNCAGVNILEPMGSLSATALKHVMDVNLIAPMLVTNAVVPYMKEQGCGSIVDIASLSSVTAFDRHSAYCASKEGLLGYVKVAAMELGRYGIRINAVGPTVVLTEMGKAAWDSDPVKRERMESFIPLGRFLECDDVSPVVMFLLSSAASMISGEFLLVDGGYMAGKGI